VEEYNYLRAAAEEELHQAEAAAEETVTHERRGHAAKIHPGAKLGGGPREGGGPKEDIPERGRGRCGGLVCWLGRGGGAAGCCVCPWCSCLLNKVSIVLKKTMKNARKSNNSGQKMQGEGGGRVPREQLRKQLAEAVARTRSTIFNRPIAVHIHRLLSTSTTHNLSHKFLIYSISKSPPPPEGPLATHAIARLGH